MKQFPLRGTVNYERRQPEKAKFQPASITKPKNVRNAERGMNQGVARPSAKRATTARSRRQLQETTARNKRIIFVREEANIEENNGSTSDYSYFIGHTDYIKNGTIEKIKVNGKEIPMMKDTGASLTLISKKLWKQIGQPKLEEKNTGIETYDKHKMKYPGAFFSTVFYNNKELNVNIAVVDADRNFGLLVRDIINNSKESIDRCFKAEASEKLPIVKGAKASIKLKPDAKPMFCAARKVLLPLERKVNKTIDKLLLLGILEPVEAGGVDNCSPVVWVKKGDKLRMCADYKIQVNDKISTEAYPLPCNETIFSKVSGAKFFAKIDLSNAYWQIPLDEKSQYVCTVNTTRGLFGVTRLQQGLKNAAAIFQQAIEEVLKGLDGCVAYQDDIFLFGVTEAEVRKRYNAVKERLAAKNFTVKEDKCVSFSTTLSFLGYEISSEGVKRNRSTLKNFFNCSHRRMSKKLKLLSDLSTTLGE